MGVLTKELRNKVANQAKQNKKTLKLKTELRPIFFTFDTLDGGRVDKVRTRQYRTTSF